MFVATLTTVLSSTSAWAQATGRITGTVTTEGGTPLAGAQVAVTGTQLGARTGANGQFTIDGVSAGSRTVRATMIGYTEASQTVTVAAGQAVTANLRLSSSAVQLEGIVAVGYGTQRAEALTGAVGAVTAEQIAQKPVARVTEALQGATPGLTVIQRSAQPGRQDVQFNVRGRGSLGNTTPLVLVDGVPGDINQLNPTDIESITVLKDASSAAIYGSRAANGVVLVNTKRGRGTGGLQLSYDGYYGIQGINNMPKTVGPREYLNLINEAAVNAGFTPRYSDADIEGHVKTASGAPDADPIRYPWTDWIDTLFNPAPIQEHTLGLSGGSELARFNLSFNYMDHQGMLPNTAADRVGARLNSDFNINERLTAGVDLALRRNTDVESHEQGQVLFRMFHDTPPTVRAQFPDGTYGWSRNNHNPLAYAEAFGDRNRAQLYGSANAKADYQLFEGFTIRTQASAQVLNGTFKDFRNQVSFTDFFNPSRIVKSVNTNRLVETRGDAREIYLRALGEYEKSFGDHDITAMLGYDQTARDSTELGAIREGGFHTNDLRELNAGDAARDDNFGTSTEWRLRSGFSRVNYAFAGKYLFEANARYDGSSRFAKGNRFGFFPSVSAGWRLSEEPFFQDNVGFFDELKLRASWGRMGNQDIGLYRYFPTIAFGHTYVFGNSLVTGAAQTRLANQDISWETTEMTNVGLDASVLDGRLSMTADAYTKTTDGILLELPIPNIIGFGAPVQNAAVVNNKGWELGLNWRDGFGDVNYSVGLNLWDNVNKIVSLAGTGPYIGFPFITREGGSLGDMWGYESLGLFRDAADVASSPKQASPLTGPGDIKYKDQNGDGRINQDDRVVIGNDLPRYQLGSNLSAGWRGLDASVFFQGVMKANVYQTGALVEGPVWENFTTEVWLDRWTKENPNPNARMPKPSLQRHHNHGEWTDFWVGDASYLKLKSAQIGYELPSRFTDLLSSSSVRVYVSGQNLLTFSSDLVLDPEFPSGRGTVYPQTRTISFGTSMRF
ncbi:MAG: TonB-dependent receptor [Gemmatimonadetes bacterium]|nr:TonB-dependent receptor [Gemmatimonadota bacterium]